MAASLETAISSTVELSVARAKLQAFSSQGHGPSEVAETLQEVKTSAVQKGDPLLANAAWCLEQIDTAQREYVHAINACRERRFYEGWCALEDAENALQWLGRHFDDRSDKFGVLTLRDRIPRLQRLFPYRVFFSPGFAMIRERCSICNAEIRLRASCGHRRFDLYDGQMCGRIVDEVKVLEVSIVERPFQKYSVVFPTELGSYNYALVDYAVRGIRSPWEPWSITIEKRARPAKGLGAPEFRGLRRNNPCGCGSGKKFKKCCLGKEEEYDHYIFAFEHGPPPSLPGLIPDAHVAGIDEPTKTEADAAAAVPKTLP